VHEGEAVYFPDQWWHATLNLDETVFMSSFVNYAFDGSVGADELDDVPLGGRAREARGYAGGDARDSDETIKYIE
jgi:hypothetical protein